MKSYQKILLSIIIGVLTIPTVAMGGSIVNSLIHGKSVPEAIQILAEQIESLTKRVEVVETKQVEQEETTQELQEQFTKERACREADELFHQAEYVYSQGSHRVITALTVNDFISETQRMLQEYQWLANDQNFLCPPTTEGIKTYCTTGNDHLSYHNHIFDFSLPSDVRMKSAGNLIITCDVYPSDPSKSWQNKIDEMIERLKKDCKDMVDFNEEFLKQQTKLTQLQELNAEYLTQKELCEQQ